MASSGLIAAARLSSKLAGVAFGAAVAETAADALDAEREIATVRLPPVRSVAEYEAARAKAAARGGFTIAGACALREDEEAGRRVPASVADGSVVSKTKMKFHPVDENERSAAEATKPSNARSTLRVVAVNGEALLCEYAVSTLVGSCALERERCVWRAEESDEFLSRARRVTKNQTDEAGAEKNLRDWSGAVDEPEGSPEVSTHGTVTLDPEKPVGFDLTASMSASMGRSLFAPK
jgi:hypothetical protein